MGPSEPTAKSSRSGRKPRAKRFIDAAGQTHVVSKNPNGSGTVYFNAGRDRWETSGKNPHTGSVVRASAKTREAAESRLAAKLAEAPPPVDRNQSAVVDSTATVAQLLDYWQRVNAEPRTRVTTLASYRKRIAVLNVHIGDRLVSELRRADLGALVVLLSKTSKPSHIKNLLVPLRLALNEAVDLELIQTNPLDRLKLPATTKQPKRALEIAEQRALVREALDTRFRQGIAVALLFGTGLRISEVLGLRWDDLDFDAGRMTIARAASYLDGVGVIIGPTKTDSTEGKRVLPSYLHAPLRELRRHQEEQQQLLGAEWDRTADGFVFRGTFGQHVNRQTITKEVQRVCRSLNLDGVGLGTHGGRRTVVTNLYVDGQNIDDIAAAVGPADVKTTRGYVQHRGDRAFKAGERMGDLLGVE